ncbi:uncharacterized protein LOC130013589 [Patella vulgata]|uniref:uncharacterized protein LOC130013589 n=1 Tax=Patella vulgata TaxID=6465 RepID=UPI0024A923F9|nr:uncharacterized protein LOC130013589 [Patella vulgata]
MDIPTRWTVGNSLVLTVSLSSKTKQKKNADLTAIIVLAFVDLFVFLFLITGLFIVSWLPFWTQMAVDDDD